MMKNLLPAILCMALALGLSACGRKDTPPVETETDGAMGTLSGSKGEKDSRVGVFSGSGEETAEAELAEESLNLLYDAMAYDDRHTMTSTPARSPIWDTGSRGTPPRCRTGWWRIVPDWSRRCRFCCIYRPNVSSAQVGGIYSASFPGMRIPALP